MLPVKERPREAETIPSHEVGQCCDFDFSANPLRSDMEAGCEDCSVATMSGRENREARAMKFRSLSSLIQRVEILGRNY